MEAVAILWTFWTFGLKLWPFRCRYKL